MVDLISEFQELVQLSQSNFWTAAIIIFIAGIVRGFAGFALSAITMAGLAFFIAPVELIPVCYILEGVASVVMFRGGIKQADMKIVWGLAIGSAIGAPVGLLATTTFPIETSKTIALLLVISLAVAQLFKLSPKFLATKPGLYASGLTAGIATGLASVGGMVVALYVLAQGKNAKMIRGSLVMYLFIGMFTSLIYLIFFDMMDALALTRGLLFAPICLAGVGFGSLFFRPSLEGFYKRFCLILLISLAAFSLARLLI